MSEIEKMYENAGINKRCYANIKFDDCIYSPSDCGNYNYPDFTAEKQFFILKFFADNKIGEERPIIQFHWDDIDEQYYFYLQIPPDCYHAHDKDFAIALAKLVNLIWQSLTEEEKQQIKEILE